MEGFLNPKEILSNLYLRETMLAAEFGCGAGGFVIPLAKRLREGKVYALDIQEEPLSILRSKARTEGLSNIEAIRCDLERKEGSTLADSCLDIVLIPNILFQAENKKAIIKEANRVLKQEGKLLIIDWIPNVPFGPGEKSTSQDKVKAMTEALGFKFDKDFVAGKFHYALLFEKL